MGQSSSRASREAQEPQERRRDRRSTFFPRPTSTIFEDLLRPSSQALPAATTAGPPQPPLPPLHDRGSTSSRYSRPPPQQPPSSSTRSRLFRSRNSFTNSIPSIFTRHSSSSSSQRVQNLPSPPIYQDFASAAIERGTDTNTNDDDSEATELDAFDTTFRELTGRSPVASGPSSRSASRRRHIASESTDQIPSLLPDRNFRNRTGTLRRRREEVTSDGRGASEDNTAILTRLLSLTAAATAASLMGNSPDRAITRFRAAGGLGEDDDGSFDGFLRELSAGRMFPTNQAMRSLPLGEGELVTRAPGLDFLRMFRVGSINTARRNNDGSPQPSTAHGEESTDQEHRENPDDTEEGRMVPILIVGIRSLNGSGGVGRHVGDNLPALFDAFASLPQPMSMALGENGDVTEDALPSQAPEIPLVQQRRRASMGGFGLFSRDRDASSTNNNRPLSEVRDTTFSDTPPGSYPPPTTPASPPLSTLSSRTLTPIHSNRASVAGLPSLLNMRRDSMGIQSVPSAGDVSNEETPRLSRPTRHRRLSESDFTRFGSGAARRNGVHLDPPDNATPEGNRSWVIYVLGGNYPENHPILSTPSLFTDSPSYEDMILLSTLIGPAKPPVASAEDLANAPGVLRIGALDASLDFVATDGTEIITIAAEERCQVCLNEYQMEEVVRRLVKCAHVFHRECVDQVSLRKNANALQD